MKHLLFISYSNADIDKVELIKEELKDHPTFSTLIIAANREPLKPLAEKVANGIKAAKAIIPIITSNSIHTQWINQEIGYATAIERKLVPIVESGLINDLKGFIHKQIDLPYTYDRKPTNGQENRNFLSCFKILISDLEKQYTVLEDAKPLVRDTFAEGIRKLEEAEVEQNFQDDRKQFLNSNKGFSLVNKELKSMFDEILQKRDLLKIKNFHFGLEEDQPRSQIVVKGEGYSFSIAWGTERGNSLEGNKLITRFWKGMVMLDMGNRSYLPDRVPQLLSETHYQFDINRNGQTCWIHLANKAEHSTTQIVDNCFHWFLDRVAKAKTGK